MVNKKTLLKYTYLILALAIIGLTIFIVFKSGAYYWPYSHIARGVLAGVVICIIISIIKKKELTQISLLIWTLPLGALGAFWCCVQIGVEDPTKIIVDTLAIMFGTLIFFSTAVSFSIMQIIASSKQN